MIVVVSNTSPLTNLAAIEQFDLLRQLYGELHIAEGVWNELKAKGKRWPGAEQVATANWIKRHGVKNQDMVDALTGSLDRGEAESIALAKEMSADLILLDKREGRHTAQRLGIHVIGTVGILHEAKKKGVLIYLRPYLDASRQIAGFYLSDSLYQSVLAIAGEGET